MITPRLLSVKKKSIIVDRVVSAGSYVHGEWVDSTTEQITIQANVQPTLNWNQSQRLSAGDRTKQAIVLYSIQELYMSKEGPEKRAADVVHYRDQLWQVRSSIVYDMGTLNHCEAVAILFDEV